jgi:hypothetical protein
VHPALIYNSLRFSRGFVLKIDIETLGKRNEVAIFRDLEPWIALSDRGSQQKKEGVR